jgi:predicted metal-binding membrane protein
VSAIPFVTPRIAWRHPEWWALAIAACAWMAMLQPHAHHSHGAFALWVLMTLAMMVPMVVLPMRTAAERSLWRRRHRAIAGFLIGYLACWAIVGILIARIELRFGAAIAFAIAAAWQLTPQKRRALTACHRTMPLAPRGWRADRDCIRYGLRIGARCVISCWALMLACVLTGHALLATRFVTTILLYERDTRRPHHLAISAALLAASVVTLATG